MRRKRWNRRAAAAALTLALTVPTAGAVRIGSVVDHVRYTDIVAYIDEHPAPSYNVGGNTVVVAEDLADYGFEVEWSQEKRALYIGHSATRPISADYVPEENTHVIGSRAMPVLATDIVVYAGGVQIPSWNVGGRTVLSMDALAERFGCGYRWDQESRTLRLYTDWSRDLSAPDSGDALRRGFAVKATGFSRDSEEVTLEGEGGWSGIDNLKIGGEGVSFSLYQRVLGRYDGCLGGLSSDAATFSPIRDNILENKRDNTPEIRAELQKYLRVYVNGQQKAGELWLGYGNGHTDYTFRFDEPVCLDQMETVYVAAGDAFWMADHALPYEWEEARYPAGRCEVFSSELAHVYRCSQGGVMHGGNEALLVVYPDGTVRDYLEEMPALGAYQMNTSYAASDVQMSGDGASFTFRCPVYEVSGSDPCGPDYKLEFKGTGLYRVDLVTREMTLEETSGS